MDLTQLDKELLDGLQVLTDQEIGRVQAHLAAGLPMSKDFGWNDLDSPSCFGCVVGVSQSRREHGDRWSKALGQLATITFPDWVSDCEGLGFWTTPIPQRTLERLAALLDTEWSRRVMATSNPVEQSHDTAAPSPLPAESSHDAIIPSPEAVGV